MIADNELKQIIIQALPEVSCHVSNANVIAKRVWLEKKIIDYLGKQLSNQFNARHIN